MNRAWIPAGALAGVSVAGLLALGPLTDSMGTSVPYPTANTAPSQGTGKPGASQRLEPVSLDITVRHPVGSTTTSRGSEATPPADSNASQGFVSVHIKPPPKTNTPQGTARIVTTAPKPKPKKPAASPRKSTTIGTTGETNDSSGLTGSGSTTTGHGATSQTPSSDGP